MFISFQFVVTIYQLPNQQGVQRHGQDVFHQNHHLNPVSSHKSIRM